MTKDEALRMALKKAFDLGKRYRSWADSEYPSHWKKADVAIEQFDQLIDDTIREVLAQPEGCQCPACKITPHASDCAVHNAPAYPIEKCNCGAQPYPDNFIDALKFDVAKRDSDAQQVREHAPCKGMNCGITRTDQEHSLECQAEHAAAIAGGTFMKPEQEPVASNAYDKIDRFLRNNLHDDDYAEYSSALDSLYTTPPQRKPLSSVELVKIELSLRKYHDYDRYDLSLHDFARAIEAAHGITGEQK